MAHRRYFQSIVNSMLAHLLSRNFAIAQNWAFSDIGGLARDLNEKVVRANLLETPTHPRLKDLNHFLSSFQEHQMLRAGMPKSWLKTSDIIFKLYPKPPMTRDCRFVYIQYVVQDDLGKKWSADGVASFLIFDRDYLEKRASPWNFRGSYGMQSQ